MGIFSWDEWEDYNYNPLDFKETPEDENKRLRKRLRESEEKYARLINKLAQNKYYIKLRLQGKI